LAKNVLTQAEIEQVLLGPTLKTAGSLRDRALLEVLYACALRRGELLRLNQQDIDSDYRLLHIRQSKGAKDRIIPISCRALQWVKRYQQEARIILEKTDKMALFLGQRGRRLGKDMCKDKVEVYIEQAVPDKSGGCHLMRHSVATLLLNQGCDIRVIQEFLGHKDLKTTQHYLHVNMTQLKKMYQQYHPAG
jgi:integrase/recombinase XerD